MASKSGDTAHLYDGKTVRSSAPSRKKLAAKGNASAEIPKDAIPTVEIPTFIESLLGGPLVPKTKFSLKLYNIQISWEMYLKIKYHLIAIFYSF